MHAEAITSDIAETSLIDPSSATKLGAFNVLFFHSEGYMPLHFHCIPSAEMWFVL